MESMLHEGSYFHEFGLTAFDIDVVNARVKKLLPILDNAQIGPFNSENAFWMCLTDKEYDDFFKEIDQHYLRGFLTTGEIEFYKMQALQNRVLRYLALEYILPLEEEFKSK